MEADGTGRWIERVCIDARDLAEIDDNYPGASDLFTSTARVTDIARAIQRRPLYVRPRAAPALVEEARSRLAFPLLRPRFTPAAPWTFVYLPTALWLDGEALQPRTATAEVPGVRVTVTAEPEEIHWATGDGAVVVCRAPGRPPNPAVPGDRGDCTHIWSWPSAGRAANSYEVTATVFWHVTWTAEGAPGGGDLGIVPQRSDVLRVPVAEIQVLNAPPIP